MQRYFFNIHNGTGLTEDLEGLELEGPEAAREQALSGIRSLVREEVEKGLVDLDGHLDVVDAAGTLIFSVSFREAVTFRMRGGDAK